MQKLRQMHPICKSMNLQIGYNIYIIYMICCWWRGLHVPGMKNILVNMYCLALKASQNNDTEYFGIVNNVHYPYLSHILSSCRWSMAQSLSEWKMIPARASNMCWHLWTKKRWKLNSSPLRWSNLKPSINRIRTQLTESGSLMQTYNYKHITISISTSLREEKHYVM